MATSGHTDVAVTKYDTLRFNWWQIEQSISGNYTKIGWNTQLIAGSSGRIDSTASKSWSTNVNGTPYSGTNKVGISNNTTKTLASGETIIYHNDDGSKKFSYSFSQYFGITFSGSSIGTISGSGSAWLEPIARQAIITSAPDFTDAANPVIEYNNPAGSDVKVETCISFTGQVDITYREIKNPGKSGTYTYSLTEDEWNVLRRNTNSNQNWRYLYLYIRTTIGGKYYYSYKQCKFTVTDDEPTIDSTVTIVDDLTKNLTGNENTIIKGVTTVDYAVNATAYKEASINGQWMYNNGRYYYNDASGTVYNVQDGYFLFAASDTRGRHLRDEVGLNIINYVKLSCGFTHRIEFVDDVEDEINIKISVTGKYFNGTFGAQTNHLSLGCMYKINDNGDWISLQETPNIIYNGDNYSVTFTIPNLDYRNTYTVKCVAEDALGVVETSPYPIKALPVFDWSEEDFNFNVPISIEKQPLADFVIEEGTLNGSLVINGTEYTTAFNYRKWKRGIIEAWCAPSFSTAVNTAYGSGYYNGSVLKIKFPTNMFKYVPIASMLVRTSDAQLYSINVAEITASDISFYISSMMQHATATDKCINVKLYGFWK